MNPTIEPAEALDDGLRPEYEPGDLKDSVRGKYLERYRAHAHFVLLEADVARAFPTTETVNEALRLLMRLAEATLRPQEAEIKQ